MISVPAQDQVRTRGRLKEWVRDQNQEWGGRLGRTRPSVDVVGNRVPTDAVFLNRNTIINNTININYTNIVNNFGSPGFPYAFSPGAVWGGGFHFARHRHSRTIIVINFFYPFYFTDPYFVGGLYYPGYYPAPYAYFGWCPAWIYPSRAYYAPDEYIYAPATPYRYYGHNLDQSGARRAIEDVREAWLSGDINPLAAHLTDQIDIRVYFDGEYSYSSTTDDFYAMTLDTLATTRTVSMRFDPAIWISSREVFYTGRQVFEDPDGAQNSLYVSFRFRNLGSEWYLVAIGTSKYPIQHQYTDFRYN